MFAGDVLVMMTLRPDDLQFFVVIFRLKGRAVLGKHIDGSWVTPEFAPAI